MTHNADVEFRPEKSIPVDLNQPIVLEIHNPYGDVTVRAVDRTDVLIGSGAPGVSGDLGDDEVGLTINARDNRIEVRPDPRVGPGWAGVAGEIDFDAVVGQITRAFWSAGRPGKVRFASGRRAWSDITIEVPRSITGQVEIHTASGDVHVEGVTGEIALNTRSGNARVVRTGGNLVLQTASGDLVVEGASGRFTARAASGDIRVTSAQFDGFQIQSANGDILLDAMLAGDGPYHAQTASGDVRLTLRRPTVDGEEPAASLAFHTVSGDAHVTAPFRKTERQLWQSGSGDRGPRIDVTTVSGDLTAAIAAADSVFVPAPSPAVFADDVPPEPPAPPPAVVPDWPRSEGELAVVDTRPTTAPSTAHGNAVRHAVLEAVERGEIDVEEALRRLDAEDATANT